MLCLYERFVIITYLRDSGQPRVSIDYTTSFKVVMQKRIFFLEKTKALCFG